MKGHNIIYMFSLHAQNAQYPSFSSLCFRHWRLFSYIRVSPCIHGVMKKSEKDRVRRVGSLTCPCVHATRLVLTGTRGLPTATLPDLFRTTVNFLLLPWSNMSSAMMSIIQILRKKGLVNIAFLVFMWNVHVLLRISFRVNRPGEMSRTVAMFISFILKTSPFEI
jgi:hypothetical protein